MPTKEHQIEELKERIVSLKDFYNKMEEIESAPLMLGMIAIKICELEEKLAKLESK